MLSRLSRFVRTPEMSLLQRIQEGSVTSQSQILKQRLVSPVLSRFFADAPQNQPPKRGKDPTKGKGPISWKSLGISAAVCGALTLFMLYVKKEKEMALDKERKRQLGKAKIGGTFDLIDHDNKPRKSEDFLGQWILLYFGFTHCPDVCPDELEKMAEVVDKIDGEPKVPNIQPLFITVDPERDTTALIKDYLSEFHPKMIGMTGTVEKIAEACRAYRVYFSAGPRDDDDDYIVDHTIIIYLVNPDGEFVDYYGQTRNADQVVDSVMLNMTKYQQANKSTFANLLGS